MISDIADWKICFEIGLNHLGSYENVATGINNSFKKGNPIALTFQIREESFYSGDNEKYKLPPNDYLRAKATCERLGIPFGIALGPLEDLSSIHQMGIQPDFLKLIAIATKDVAFLDRVRRAFDCPIFLSVGLTDIEVVRTELISRMRPKDRLVHTALSHESKDQDLGRITRLGSLGAPVDFGLHAESKEIAYASIGAGAEKIFVYVGDKSQKLPDYEHALDFSELDGFIQGCMTCFDAVQDTEGDFNETKIKFIG